MLCPHKHGLPQCLQLFPRLQLRLPVCLRPRKHLLAIKDKLDLKLGKYPSSKLVFWWAQYWRPPHADVVELVDTLS